MSNEEDNLTDYQAQNQEEMDELSEEQEKEFIVSRIRNHRRIAVLKGSFGILLTLIVASLPINIWGSEISNDPRIFSGGWFATHNLEAIIVAIVLLIVFSLLPLIPIIWSFRRVKIELLECRRLKQFHREYYSPTPRS